MAEHKIAWENGSGNITLSYNGEGDETVLVTSDENTMSESRSQTITVKTSNNAVSKTITVSQGACPIPVGTVKSFSYTGTVQSVTLPKGLYKLQCWGAQGGSNAAASAYSITAQAGGKGGYSEGVLSLDKTTTLYVFVGGQGAASGNGGWNGGGGGGGSSSYNASGTVGQSRMGCGGGATDIALVTSSMSYSSYRTNRSSESLLSRIIVAGGGSGGAMTYRAITSTVDKYTSVFDGELTSKATSGSVVSKYKMVSITNGKTYRVKIYGASGSTVNTCNINLWSASANLGRLVTPSVNTYATFTVNNTSATRVQIVANNGSGVDITAYATLEEVTTTSSTTTSNDKKVGYVGGGTNGGGYSSTYYGQQSKAGNSGGFGYGASMTISNYRYCSACGGGGWYGGGSAYSDTTITYVKYSGGGSGFVNIASNAQYRPSGYTGLQLDSGETKAGNVSFPSTSGGTETGHSGNGYARITRIT